MIYVTKTFLPPQEEYNLILKRAWDKYWITNRGELVNELEDKLRAHLSVKNIIITNNGTVPLQIAIKTLGLSGEIITTPFSYIATTASIIWENCVPVFVDIDAEYLTIDEQKMEDAVTPRTTAILATHVFGNPCNIEAIEVLAKKYNLKVIYDAAHCFGVKYKNESIFNYGDVSTCSFHATKLFHTAEGGAMFCSDSTLHHKLYYHHNFGHNGPLAFSGLGINAKISELQAAMGLAVYPYINTIINARKKIVDRYNKKLINKSLTKIKLRKHTEWNYSYYPLIFESELQLLDTLKALNNASVFPRRYFYPALNTIDYIKAPEMPVAESIAKRILCLPLYHDLSMESVDMISTVLLKSLH